MSPGPLTERILEQLPEKGLRGTEESDPGTFFDREGFPLSLDEWARLFDYPPYRVVGNTHVGGYRVSTVWLGIDHSFGGGAPLIFESMVFEAEPSFKGPQEGFSTPSGIDFPPMPGYWYHRDYEQIRYSTEEQAQEGHEKLVEEVRLFVSAIPDPRNG